MASSLGKLLSNNILHTNARRGALTNNGRFQVDKHSSGDVLSSASLTEEGIKGVVSSTDGFIGWHLSVRLDAMLQTVELPAGIADLHSGLSNVDGDTLTLKDRKRTQIVTADQVSTTAQIHVAIQGVGLTILLQVLAEKKRRVREFERKVHLQKT